jgi:hypothetical protein
MIRMKNIFWILISLGFIFNSCKKEADRPPLGNEYTKSYSVAELRAIASCTGTCSKRFTQDVYFTGVVIADHTTGNFYKELYVRDRYNTGAIHLDLKSSSYYVFVGDSVRLNLNGYDVGYNSSTGMLEIDSVDNEKHLRKFASGADPQPIDIDLSTVNYSNYHCDLVRINNVGFISADAGQIYADAIGQMSLNRTLQDCGGTQIVVRTSNYASFAQEKTPAGWGSIIGIATAYGTTNQLAIRKTAEVNMNGAGCITYLQKDFDDGSITSGGWAAVSVLDPAVTWTTSTFTGYTYGKYAKISGYYATANHNVENWLISPSMNLTGAANPVLTFLTMANFSGPVLEVKVSNNYTSGLPSTATWTALTGFSLSSTGYSLTPSGNVLLNAYKSGTTRVAFTYTANTGGSKTYEVDNILVKEN